MTARKALPERGIDEERLSALIDGELDAGEADALIDALCRDRALAAQWSDLNLVGDALRSTEVAACHAEGFCARVSRALSGEPTILAPRRGPGLALRHLVPGLAIAASIAAVGFVAVPLLRSPAAVSTIADAPATATIPTAGVAAPQDEPAVATPAPPQLAQARVPAAIASVRALNPYFAAHRELTAGSALPRATVYLRTSGEER